MNQTPLARPWRPCHTGGAEGIPIRDILNQNRTETNPHIMKNTPTIPVLAILFGALALMSAPEIASAGGDGRGSSHRGSHSSHGHSGHGSSHQGSPSRPSYPSCRPSQPRQGYGGHHGSHHGSHSRPSYGGHGSHSGHYRGPSHGFRPGFSFGRGGFRISFGRGRSGCR